MKIEQGMKISIKIWFVSANAVKVPLAKFQIENNYNGEKVKHAQQLPYIDDIVRKRISAIIQFSEMPLTSGRKKAYVQEKQQVFIFNTFIW